MGSQAAVLLDEAISNRAGGGLQAPLGSKLVINADTARAIHVNLDGGALSVADLVVRDREQPRAAVPGSGDPATHP
jgi:hypothetical protein